MPTLLARTGPVVLVAFLVLVPLVAGHGANSTTRRDEHQYVGLMGDLAAVCKLHVTQQEILRALLNDPDAEPLVGFNGGGGDCFDFGEDLLGGDRVNITIADVAFNEQTLGPGSAATLGWYYRFSGATAGGTRVWANPAMPVCAFEAENIEIPKTPIQADRLWVWLGVGLPLLACNSLSLAAIGLPAVTGTITVETRAA